LPVSFEVHAYARPGRFALVIKLSKRRRILTGYAEVEYSGGLRADA